MPPAAAAALAALSEGEGSEMSEEEAMAALMGFGGFDSTKVRTELVAVRRSWCCPR